MQISEDQVEAAVRHFVLTEAALGIYDPLNPRRPKMEVVSFEVELLEIEDDMTVHAAGPVVLRTNTGDVEKFLRVSVGLTPDGKIAEGGIFRAAYIEEISPETGACKETAALANE